MKDAPGRDISLVAAKKVATTQLQAGKSKVKEEPNADPTKDVRQTAGGEQMSTLTQGLSDTSSLSGSDEDWEVDSDADSDKDSVENPGEELGEESAEESDEELDEESEEELD